MKLADPAESKYGLGFSLDQELSSQIQAFARYGWRPGDEDQVQFAASAGVRVSEVFGIEDNALGFAYGLLGVGKNRQKPASEDSAPSSGEHRLEIYYQFTVHRHLAISPDIQWVHNPLGDGGHGEICVLGIRAQLSL